MPFVIHHNLAGEELFEELKEIGDQVLAEAGLGDYAVEVRPATDLEEKSVAGEGLAPVEDSGDNFVPDTARMVVYRTERAENPLLKGLDEDPAACARTLVDRLSEHLESYDAQL